jgi:hypothetical protein
LFVSHFFLLNTSLWYGIILLFVFRLIQNLVHLRETGLHILCLLPVLQFGGHWVSLRVCATN